jgi:hypothetical protein
MLKKEGTPVPEARGTPTTEVTPSTSVADPGCLSRILDPDFYSMSFDNIKILNSIVVVDFYPYRIPDPGSRIPDPKTAT